MMPATRPRVGAPLLLAVGLLVAACAALPELSPVSPAVLGDGGPALLARLAAEEVSLVSLRGLATVAYDGPTGRGSASQAILVALPDRARLETLSPVGTPVLILVIRGEELRVHSLLRQEFGIGRATRETLGRLTRAPVPPRPLLRLLVGLPPLPVRPDDPRFHLIPEAETLRMESVDGPFWQRLWTGPDGAAIAHGELGEASGVLLAFEFGERRLVGGAAFPFLVRIDEPGSGARLAIRYERVRLNEPVEAGVFELPRPQDDQLRIFELGGGPPLEDSLP